MKTATTLPSPVAYSSFGFYRLALVSAVVHLVALQTKVAFVGLATSHVKHVVELVKTLVSPALRLTSTSSTSLSACKHVPTDTLKVSIVKLLIAMINDDDSVCKNCQRNYFSFRFNFVTFNHNFSMSPTREERQKYGKQTTTASTKHNDWEWNVEKDKW